MGAEYRKRTEGFSLLEALVAVLVLSVGMVAILQANSSCIRSSALACDIVKASFLAKDKLQELEFKEGLGLIKDEPKDAQGTSGKFEWRYSAALDPELKLYALNFSISWQRSNRKEEIKLNTYLR